MLVQYVIRWDRKEAFGADFAEAFGDDQQHVYVKDIRLGVSGRGVWSARAVDDAIKFSSWAEAAAVAAFIIFHIDEMYEETLDIVKVDL